MKTGESLIRKTGNALATWATQWIQSCCRLKVFRCAFWMRTCSKSPRTSHTIQCAHRLFSVRAVCLRSMLDHGTPFLLILDDDKKKFSEFADKVTAAQYLFSINFFISCRSCSCRALDSEHRPTFGCHASRQNASLSRAENTKREIRMSIGPKYLRQKVCFVAVVARLVLIFGDGMTAAHSPQFMENENSFINFEHLPLCACLLCTLSMQYRLHVPAPIVFPFILVYFRPLSSSTTTTLCWDTFRGRCTFQICVYVCVCVVAFARHYSSTRGLENDYKFPMKIEILLNAFTSFIDMKATWSGAGERERNV